MAAPKGPSNFNILANRLVQLGQIPNPLLAMAALPKHTKAVKSQYRIRWQPKVLLKILSSQVNLIFARKKFLKIPANFVFNHHSHFNFSSYLARHVANSGSMKTIEPI